MNITFAVSDFLHQTWRLLKRFLRIRKFRDKLENAKRIQQTTLDFLSKQCAVEQEIEPRNVLERHSLRSRHVAALTTTDTPAPYHNIRGRSAENANETKVKRHKIVFVLCAQKEELSSSHRAKGHDIRDNVFEN